MFVSPSSKDTWGNRRDEKTERRSKVYYHSRYLHVQRNYGFCRLNIRFLNSSCLRTLTNTGYLKWTVKKNSIILYIWIVLFNKRSSGQRHLKKQSVSTSFSSKEWRGRTKSHRVLLFSCILAENHVLSLLSETRLHMVQTVTIRSMLLSLFCSLRGCPFFTLNVDKMSY